MCHSSPPDFVTTMTTMQIATSQHQQSIHPLYSSPQGNEVKHSTLQMRRQRAKNCDILRKTRRPIRKGQWVYIEAQTLYRICRYRTVKSIVKPPACLPLACRPACPPPSLAFDRTKMHQDVRTIYKNDDVPVVSCRCDKRGCGLDDYDDGGGELNRAKS